LNSFLEQENLGLSQREYQDLIIKIDSVIHAAALVKHYGDYTEFYLANVQVTINLLEFTKLTKLKDFHYISTYSVLNNNGPVATEADTPNIEGLENVYLKTKLQGEQQAIKYRDYGIKSNIYRIGNLAFMAENCRTQENLAENAFFNWVKCLFKLQYIAPEISLVDISPADLTAQAIVKLFDKMQLSNEIYHVFNPYLFDLSKVEAKDKDQAWYIKTLPIDKFIDLIIFKLTNDASYHDLIMQFLLHQGWLDDFVTKDMIATKISQNKTQCTLEQLGFTWTPITSKVFSGFLKLLI
jgi:surfactin family lipopeptide synthetase A